MIDRDNDLAAGRLGFEMDRDRTLELTERTGKTCILSQARA
jgi:hypothetical protein